MHPKLAAALAALDNGDAKPLIGIGMRAVFSGERCECIAPELTGWDLMCAECLRENDDQRIHRELAMKSPHDFIPRDDGGIAMCSFCSGWRNDPRHGDPVAETLTDRERTIRAIVDRVLPTKASESDA